MKQGDAHPTPAATELSKLAAAPLPATAPEAEGPETQPALDQSIESQLPVGSTRNRGFARRVVGSTFNYGMGKFIPQLVRFLLIPIFTRLISPEGYGFIDLSNKFGTFLVTPMKLGVPGAVTRFYYDYPEGPSLKDYVTTVMWFVILCSLTVGIAAIVIGPWALGHLVPGLPFLPFAVLAIISALLLGITEMQDRLVQAREQSGYAARLNLGRASISILLAVLFVVGLRWGAPGLLSAEVASYGVLAYVAARYLRFDLRGRFHWPMLRSSLVYGLAMMPGDFVGSLTPLVTQAILADSKSFAASGLLTMASRFAQPLVILAYAFQTAFNPIYFSMRKASTAAGMQRLAVTARNVWALAIFGALGVALLGPWMLVLMTPRNYHAAAPLLPIFSVYFLGMVIQALFGPEIYYSKQTWWVPVVVYSGAAVDITVSALTVHRFGPAGVACGMTARMIATSLFFAIISMRLVKVPHQWFNLLRITLCGAVVGSTVFWMPHQRGIAEFGIGAMAIAVFPLLLWLTGDPSVREAARLLRRVLARIASSYFV